MRCRWSGKESWRGREKQMTKEQGLMVARAVGLRLFDVFIRWPATGFGCIAVIVMLLGGSPIHDAVQGVHAWADQSFRHAEQGKVNVTVCARTGSSVPVVCKEERGAPVSVAESVEASEQAAYGIYQGMVLVTTTVMLMWMGWREFLCLPKLVEGKSDKKAGA